MSFECNWDRMLQFTRRDMVGRQPAHHPAGLSRKRRDAADRVAYDYLGVNNAVRDGHAVMLGPITSAALVGWKPFEGLADYIKEVKRIRDGLADTVFLGEVLGHERPTIQRRARRGIDYNVFRNRTRATRVCILTNSTMESKKQPLHRLRGQPDRRSAAFIPVPSQRGSANLPAGNRSPCRADRVRGGIVSRDRETTWTVAMARPMPASSLPDSSRRGAPITNGGFESGDFNGWNADPNWVIAHDSRGYYSGWQGKYWAWSGGKGEAATGKLKSKPFVLDKDAVRLLISGWNSVRHRQAAKVELRDPEPGRRQGDRPRVGPQHHGLRAGTLDGSGYQGQTVYVEAVDDADRGDLLDALHRRRADRLLAMADPCPFRPSTLSG